VGTRTATRTLVTPCSRCSLGALGAPLAAGHLGVTDLTAKATIAPAEATDGISQRFRSSLVLKLFILNLGLNLVQVRPARLELGLQACKVAIVFIHTQSTTLEGQALALLMGNQLTNDTHW